MNLVVFFSREILYREFNSKFWKFMKIYKLFGKIKISHRIFYQKPSDFFLWSRWIMMLKKNHSKHSHSFTYNLCPRKTTFLENTAILGFRPVGILRLLEPAGRAQVESGHRESVRSGRGDCQTFPGHRTMSLWHPQTDCTRLHTLHRPPQVLHTFRCICPDLWRSIDIADHMKTLCNKPSKSPKMKFFANTVRK